MQPFNYNPIYWQDWTLTKDSAGTGYIYNQRNSSLTLNCTDATDDAVYRVVYITRDFPASTKDKETYEVRMRSAPPTDSTYNETRFVLFYRYQNSSTLHGIYLYFYKTYFQLLRYDWTGGTNATNIYWSSYPAQSSTAYQIYSFILDARYATLQLQITNQAGTRWYDQTFQCEATPHQVVQMWIQQRAHGRQSGGGYTFTACKLYTQILWVRGPFPDVNGLRSWTGTGTSATDSPYWIYKDADSAHYFSTFVMPFQGFKALWNVTATSVTVDYAYCDLEIEWITMAGALYGGVMFRIIDDTADHWIYIYTIDSTGTATLRLTQWTDSREQVGIGVWTEKSGKSFAYVQYTPHSSEFQDFMLYDITSYVDLTSWGVYICHLAEEKAGTDRAYSILNEVEIFYGLREGISQPRFGGMWWESNPIIMFFLGLANIIASIFFAVGQWISSALGPVITAVGSFLSPIITAVATTIIDAFNGLVDLFVTVLIPAATTFIEAFVLVAIMLILTPITGILAIISVFLTGDPYLLPVAVVNFFLILANVFTWIGTVFAGIVTFFGMMAAVASGQPIAISGSALTLIDLINRILYYIVTFAPVAILLHVMISVLACLPKGPGGDFSIDPLIHCGLLYYHIIETIASVVFRIVSFLTSIIISIMELIPF